MEGSTGGYSAGVLPPWGQRHCLRLGGMWGKDPVRWRGTGRSVPPVGATHGQPTPLVKG